MRPIFDISSAVAVVVALAAAVGGETIITRDTTTAGAPITSAEFRLTPQSESGRVKRRALTSYVSPTRTNGEATIRVTAWGDCSFEISLPGPGDGARELTADGNPGLWWNCDRKTVMQFYERQDGGLEWEIRLDSQPSSNRLQFPIMTENLVFCYQRELTEEEIAEGARRPDSIIGSYAVYHAGCRNDFEFVSGDDTVRESYGTGKAFHVYRPKAHDANGKTAWCDLRIDTALTITVPRDFLQGSVYPVTIDPTFGCTDIGGTQTIPGTAKANINDAHTHLAGSGEAITSFSVYASSSSGTQSLGLAAYSMDSGSPKLPVTRLAEAETVSLTGATSMWYTTSTVSQSLTSGTRYCIALGDGNASTNIHYDSYGSIARSNNATSALPSNWSSGSTGTVVYSMYATYTVNAVALPPRRRRISLADMSSGQKGKGFDETMQALAEAPAASCRAFSECDQRCDGGCQQ